MEFGQSQNQKSFELERESDAGHRAGKLYLPNGVVPTPVFMPVGTQATVKGVLPRDLRECVQCPIILGNTYHLNLRPGVEIVAQAGGLSKFMDWNGPVLTDSGDFRFSVFQSYERLTIMGLGFVRI